MFLTIESVTRSGASVWTAVGVDAEGQRHRFAGDWRPMRDVADAIDAGEVIEIDVSDWQLLGGPTDD